MESGATFALLDPAHPPARLRAQMAAVKPSLLIWSEEAGPLPEIIAGVGINVSQASRLLGAPEGSAPMPSARAVRPSYIMFTSGSTDLLPRAVISGSASLAHFLSRYVSEFDIGRDSRFALLSGLGHDPLLRDVFTPLCVGGELHVPDVELRRDPLALLRWLAKRRITVLHLTPPLARLLAMAAVESGIRLPDVRLICYGGDILRYGDVKAVTAIMPSAQHVNFYGTTETPQAMAFHVINPKEVGLAADGAPVPIGRGIKDVQILVINNSGQLAGIGEIGEIVVRTPFLAKGYINASDTGGFQLDPTPGTRRFETGDRGRYLSDGSVETLGRIDRQVKVMGFRVDLTEIDAACMRLPGIDRAVTVARSSTGEAIRLTTYALPIDGSESAVDQLCADLAALLPEYMIPHEVIKISDIPLTPNGKIDYRALPSVASISGPDDLRGSEGDLEEAIRNIWKSVLVVSDVAPDGNFFDCGGTSLLMVQVQSLLRERLGVSLELVALFKYPSIGSLARHLESAAIPSLAVSVQRHERRRSHSAVRIKRRQHRGESS